MQPTAVKINRCEEQSMKDKKTLNIYKAASMVLMIMIMVLIIALWGRNDFSRYLIYDKGRIADKVMLAAKFSVMLFILYKSTVDKKYFITILSFVQAAGIFWVRFLGNKVIDSEYMKIDRLTITICIIIVLTVIFINLYTFMNDNLSFVWILISSLGFMGVALSFDLVWMDFFLALAFLGMYMWFEKGRYLILGAGIVAEIFVTISSIFAAQKIEILSIQSVIVCRAMDVTGAFYPAVMMIIAACVLLMCGAWIFIKSDADACIKLYLTSIVMIAAGTYLFIRFIPAYSGDIIGTVLKFAGAVILLLLSVYLNVVKQWKNAVMVLSMACPAGLIALFGAGHVITVWYGIMMMLIYIPLIIILYLNEDSGRYMYVHIVSVFCLILVPVEMVSYRMSAFKLYLKVENKVWLAIMAVSYVVFVIGLIRWMNRFDKDVSDSRKQTEDSGKAGRNLLCAALIILAAVIIFMPLTIKDWIYPMMSRTEIMISDISSNKVHMEHIIVTSVMVIVTFLIPILVIKISNLRKRNLKSQ